MTTILATNSTLNHGDGMIRRFGFKYKIVIHNKLNDKYLMVKIKSKPYDSLSKFSIGSNLNLCFVKQRHEEDFPEEILKIAPNSLHKVQLTNNFCIVSIEVDGQTLMHNRTIDCGYDIVVDENDLDLLFIK